MVSVLVRNEKIKPTIKSILFFHFSTPLEASLRRICDIILPQFLYTAHTYLFSAGMTDTLLSAVALYAKIYNSIPACLDRVSVIIREKKFLAS